MRFFTLVLSFLLATGAAWAATEKPQIPQDAGLDQAQLHQFLEDANRAPAIVGPVIVNGDETDDEGRPYLDYSDTASDDSPKSNARLAIDQR